MKRYAIICVITLLLYTVAQADVIHTCDGRKIVGKVVNQDEDTVTVKAKYGEVTIDRDDIERIEKGKLPEDTYKEKADALDKNDAEGHYELGLWCRENRLRPEAKKEFEKAIAADPEHEAARSELGYKKIEGEWLSTAQIKKRNRSKKKKESSKPDSSS
ncbi:MAG: hypothetical protein ACYS8W_19490, partial [Planctomycetota bacterium]